MFFDSTFFLDNYGNLLVPKFFLACNAYPYIFQSIPQSMLESVHVSAITFL